MKKGPPSARALLLAMSRACLLPPGAAGDVEHGSAKRILEIPTGTRAQKMNPPNPRERLGSWRNSAPVLLASRDEQDRGFRLAANLLLKSSVRHPVDT